MIAFYNEGSQTYTLQEINAILKGKRIDFPSTLDKLSTIHLGDEIIISENGKDVSVIIEERELMSLNEPLSDNERVHNSWGI